MDKEIYPTLKLVKHNPGVASHIENVHGDELGVMFASIKLYGRPDASVGDIMLSLSDAKRCYDILESENMRNMYPVFEDYVGLIINHEYMHNILNRNINPDASNKLDRIASRLRNKGFKL